MLRIPQAKNNWNGYQPMRVRPRACSVASQALKSFQLQPGFRMELVAAEPLVSARFQIQDCSFLVPDYCTFTRKNLATSVGANVANNGKAQDRCSRRTQLYRVCSFGVHSGVRSNTSKAVIP